MPFSVGGHGAELFPSSYPADPRPRWRRKMNEASEREARNIGAGSGTVVIAPMENVSPSSKRPESTCRLSRFEKSPGLAPKAENGIRIEVESFLRTKEEAPFQAVE